MQYTVLGKSVRINKESELWYHTKMRIENAKSKSKSPEDFEKKMIARLMKIKHRDKLNYAIVCLKDLGYETIAEMYESKILMDDLM